MRTTRVSVIPPIRPSIPHNIRNQLQETHKLHFLFRFLPLCILVLSGCGTSNLFYFPDEMARYLELQPEQNTTVYPILQDIQHSIIVYFNKTREVPDEWRGSESPELSDKEIQAEKDDEVSAPLHYAIIQRTGFRWL